MSEDTKTKDLFEDEVVDEGSAKAEDVLEGLIAERDPNSKMKSVAEVLNEPAKDVVQASLDGHLTSTARKTAMDLHKQTKLKVVIPKDPMSKIKDAKLDTVVAAINGHTFQMMRETPIMIPEEIYYLLSEGGYNPTIVR